MAETHSGAANPIVRFSTSTGDFSAEIFADKAPITAENFLSYIKEGFFDGLIFHRVIPRFMIQGGGFDKDMKQKKSKAPIKNEATNGLKNKTGTLAMARTNVVDSATSQFFINVADNQRLNFKDASPQGYGYTVFGKVIEGMDVVNKIAKAPKGATGAVPPGINPADVPTTQVVIKAAKVVGG
jgi:cyclophilin family peptidyl-prolyl cis-trans isomerase